MVSYFLAIHDRYVNSQLMVTVIMYMEENVSFRGHLRLNLIFGPIPVYNYEFMLIINVLKKRFVPQ